MAYAVGIIHEENGIFGISFPDFPGATSTGCSLEEVVAKGAEMLALHLDGMVEDKEAMPTPRGFDAIAKAEPQWVAGGLAVAIPVELPAKVLRINITLDERDLERIDRAAKDAGTSRSSYLVRAALEQAKLDRVGFSYVEAPIPVIDPGTVKTPAPTPKAPTKRKSRLL